MIVQMSDIYRCLPDIFVVVWRLFGIVLWSTVFAAVPNIDRSLPNVPFSSGKNFSTSVDQRTRFKCIVVNTELSGGKEERIDEKVNSQLKMRTACTFYVWEFLLQIKIAAYIKKMLGN